MIRFIIAAVFLFTGVAYACPSLGCGCRLAAELGVNNSDGELNLSTNWLRLGTSAPRGCIGCIAVTTRRGGAGHVGRVVGWDGPNPVIHSWGNSRIGWHTATYSARKVQGLRYVGSAARVASRHRNRRAYAHHSRRNRTRQTAHSTNGRIPSRRSDVVARSVERAYLTGNWRVATWLIKGEKVPGGKLLPDKMVLQEHEWRPNETN